MRILREQGQGIAAGVPGSLSRLPWLVACVLISASSSLPVVAQQQKSGLLGPLFWTNQQATSEPQPQPAPQSTQNQTTTAEPRVPETVAPVGWQVPAPSRRSHAARAEKTIDRYGFFAPFWMQNPQELSEVQRYTRSTDQSYVPTKNQLGQGIDLTGPLYWQNAPVRSQRARQVPTSGDFYDPGGELWSDFSPQSPLILMQGEDIPTPTGESGEIVIPIPVETTGEDAISEIVPSPPGLPGTTQNSLGSAAPGSGSLEGAQQLGEEPPPPTNQLQFLRQSAVLLEPGDMQFDIGFSYQSFQADFTVVDIANNLVEARFTQRQLVMPLEIRYGLARRAQFFIGAPFGWSQTDFATLGFDERDNEGGIGDVTTGISFLVCDGQGRCTDTVFTVAGTFPSGEAPLVDPVFTAVAPALGSGFYGLSTDLLWIDTFDPVVIFYGLGWRHQFGSNYFGRFVEPGEELRAQLGVGFALNSNVTLSTRFNVSYFTDASLDGQEFEGTFAEPMSLRFAATVANCGRLIEPFAEIGVTDDAPDGRFGITWTY
ncbi:MAG: hypothetical protein SH868_17490 [Bythopirellula sp.]|nr:hypothetical protein [Bythopirellula sp.]